MNARWRAEKAPGGRQSLRAIPFPICRPTGFVPTTLLPRLLLLLALSACAAPRLPQSTTAVSTRSFQVDWSDFTLGPNDLIAVAVFGQAELSSPPTGVRIAPDGTLALSLTGPIDLAGLTPSAAAEKIETALAAYLKRPAVSVSVVEYTSRRFFLFGEVQSTGPIPMDRPITALEALSMGGGLLPGANRTAAVIIRRHGTQDIEVIPFNAETPGPEGLVQIRSEDFIFVQKSGVGTFNENILPYLQGTGFTLSQLGSLALAYDRLYND